MLNLKIIAGIILFTSLSLSLWSIDSIYIKTNAQAIPTQTPTPTPKPETFLDRMLRIFGVTATSNNQKSPDKDLAGDIKMFDFLTGRTYSITKDGGYRWAIFLPCERIILALKGDQVVKITNLGAENQTAITIATNSKIEKLIGFNQDDKDKVLVLINEGNDNYSAGLLSLTNGQIISISFEKTQVSEKEKAMLNSLKNSERQYEETRLYVETVDNKGKISTDVYLNDAQKDPRNISNCGGIRCGQPSLSPEGRYIVYTKSAS